MAGSPFRELAAYRYAASLGDDVRAEALSWPPFDRWSLGIQLVRSADSVAANIAEATGRWHMQDKRRILFIARGSLYETEHWLLRATERELVETSYDTRLAELNRTLSGLIRRPGPR